jgi:UDP-N-acetylmuramoylalanine--D-glutamate ligase
MNETTQGRVLVLGNGASGRAAMKLLETQGREALLADERGGDAVVQQLSDATLAGVTLAVVSPGFAAEHPWLGLLRARNIPVVPEFEYGVGALSGVRVVAVTGSNGKSSVVKWMADALSANGIKAIAAGNYGLPPCEIAVSGEALQVLVLELSSFQLEQTVAFRSDVAMLLNFAPNHLDRHATMEAYAGAKAKLFSNMQSGDCVIMHAPATGTFQSFVPSGVATVRFGADALCDYFASDGVLFHRGLKAMDLSGTWWGRSPLDVNAAAALAVFDRFGISREAVRISAEEFVPLAHRMEHVVTWRGITFINDSKCSTMTALAAAVSSGREKKHLIAGGILKESTLDFVKEILAKNCAVVYCIGSSANRLMDAWGDAVPCVNAGRLEQAIREAMNRAAEGEMIMLSPGCSSFDQFASYAQRGEKFKSAVLACIAETNGK